MFRPRHKPACDGSYRHGGAIYSSAAGALMGQHLYLTGPSAKRYGATLRLTLYMRIVSPYPVTASSFSFSVGNMQGTKMECVHEAVTQNKGSLFKSYRLVISFVDNTPDNGVNPVASKAFRSIPASSYALDPSTGYPGATMVITGGAFYSSPFCYRIAVKP